MCAIMDEKSDAIKKQINSFLSLTPITDVQVNLQNV